jgi:acyl dehydratase
MIRSALTIASPAGGFYSAPENQAIPMTNEPIYFDDLKVGDVFTFGPYRVERGEMLAFSRKWDPLPVHIDDKAAREQGYRGITASGQFTLCVKQVLTRQAPWRAALIGSMGFDELRFPRPVYAGDELALTVECADTRPSRSKPDRGIVKFALRLANQDGETVLAHVDTVMFARRSEPATADPGPVPPAAVVPESQALALVSNLIVMKRNGVEQSARIAYIVNHLKVESEAARVIHGDFEAGLASGVSMAIGMPPSTRHLPADEAFHAIASQLGARDMRTMMEEERARKAQRKRRSTLVAAGICIAGAAAVAALFFMV